MKGLLYVISFLVLTACSQIEENKDSQAGYLLVSGINFSVDGEVIPLTRAVNEGLQVQILQNGVLVSGQDYAPGADFSKRIVLPVGKNYTVKAFTPDQTEAEDDGAGHPVYSVESAPFEVKEADITTITLIAPQINVGVGMQCDESFTAHFTEISVTITSESGRSVTIGGVEDTRFRYFNLPVSGQLNYTIRATNEDGEPMEKSASLEVDAKNYTIQISI